MTFSLEGCRSIQLSYSGKKYPRSPGSALPAYFPVISLPGSRLLPTLPQVYLQYHGHDAA